MRSPSGWIAVFSEITWMQATLIDYRCCAFPMGKKKTVSRMRAGDFIFPYISKAKLLCGVLVVEGPADVQIENSPYLVPGREFPVIIPVRPLKIVGFSEALDLVRSYKDFRSFRGLSASSWPLGLRTNPRELYSSDRDYVLKFFGISLS